ncbi:MULTISPECIES: hypothetical protein [Photorhabdus]|uniref:Integrase SAM-like N-terminal domain-containing protein n=3 Tax=Photorhabdus TaxID=29487 RepID=A0ABX0B1B2_9GAMM|nr:MULTISPECIES: hypothetical protein [Photorhabdus]MCC8373016.1 hypothetical protein [Photorhabdus bodei]MCT8352145.1 hypothetical protein [Photorhabdus kayaii]MDB6367934.1 hypothetical protein [Photorhabdus bodei]MDB6371746.1 hypothetical protein [Photorhabdus bodei]NDL11005.1 hypothetical protein [Photorhabdus kayaii]
MSGSSLPLFYDKKVIIRLLSPLLMRSVSTTYTQWISRWIAAARERIPGSIDNYVTGVRECSQQRSNLKDDGYK